MVSHSPRWLVHSGSAPTRCLGSTGRTENKRYVAGPVPDSVLSVFVFLRKITTESIVVRPHDIPTFPEIELFFWWCGKRQDTTLCTQLPPPVPFAEKSPCSLCSVGMFFSTHTTKNTCKRSANICCNKHQVTCFSLGDLWSVGSNAFISSGPHQTISNTWKFTWKHQW